jgi:hypothetical protein
MTVLAPPPQDELELLIREARARHRKRRLGAVALVVVLAGVALGISSIFGGKSATTTSRGGPGSATLSRSRCGVRSKGVRLFQGGLTVYREPGRYVHPNAGPGATIQCRGSTIWAVWFNGAGMSQEAYLGARSGDGGRTWHLVFTEGMFGPKAPHHLDAYLGVWTLHGSRAAYFTGTCSPCGGFGTVSLSVTKDGGATFRTYEVPALAGYGTTHVAVRGHEVTIRGERVVRKIDKPPFEIYRHKTVTLRVA